MINTFSSMGGPIPGNPPQPGAAPQLDPKMLASAIRGSAGATPSQQAAASGGQPQAPSWNGNGGAAGAAGQLASIAQQAHQKANPDMYAKSGALDWRKIMAPPQAAPAHAPTGLPPLE